jgi:hypothetical protein
MNLGTERALEPATLMNLGTERDAERDANEPGYGVGDASATLMNLGTELAKPSGIWTQARR